MTINDFKPGDIVQHSERGCGIVARSFSQRICVYYASFDGDDRSTSDLTGWERLETVRPGHVQVRVDDLDLSRWEDVADLDLSRCEGVAEKGWYNANRVAIRAANAIAAQRAGGTPPADEKPMSATVTLPCPDCGEAVAATVTLPCPDCGEAVTDTATVGIEDEGGYYLTFANSETHTCPPAQPDEPKEFGARVAVTLPDGTREKWCRLGKHHSAPWLGETYDVPGEEWGLLCGRGTVTLGWVDGEQP